ncbi:a disintegrin and metalloproteinase with thrombospondin motifs 5 [Nephila pilipes]|uniref:A disintegrin and metalloproteinase with thrombospondin motifs 5 n=1 Tax=Nephila pilipes TaxID=299642 RepID=A0A8X6JYK0_NEPPI|nr:a disintegrin and metalloproteinase with thrombospondin motifs 5 [Nephila pilipes]
MPKGFYKGKTLFPSRSLSPRSSHQHLFSSPVSFPCYRLLYVTLFIGSFKMETRTGNSMVRRTILFYLNLLILLVDSKSTYSHLPLHKRMDPSLLKLTFHVESYEKVPHYEVVHVRTLSKRSADDSEVRRVHLSAFGRDMHLQLQRNDDFDDRLKTMKMYLAESTNNGIQYKEMPAEVRFLWYFLRKITAYAVS